MSNQPMRYTAYIVQTDEILECSNLQVLYKPHAGTPDITEDTKGASCYGTVLCQPTSLQL